MAACLAPYRSEEKQMSFPCGRCPECLSRRISQWAFRLMKEYERSYSAYFVTLTFNWKHIPISKNGFRTLTKGQGSDLTNYFKRLRKLHLKRGFKNKIVYYASGEYGTKKSRPHYHIIVFNAVPDDIIEAWKKEGEEIGTIYFGEVNRATVQYVCAYITSDRLGKVGKFERDDRVREFSVMSKGIGSNYLTDKMIEWHREDPANRLYVLDYEKKKISMPRYYRDKIWIDEDEKAFISDELQKKRAEKENEEVKRLIKLLGVNWRSKHQQYVRDRFKKFYQKRVKKQL